MLPQTPSKSRSLTTFRRVAQAAAAIASTAVLVPAASAAALPGTFDTSFATTGYSLPALNQQSAAVATIVQSDGDVVAVGEALTGTTPEFAVTRLLPNGALDPTFGNGGWFLLQTGKSSLAGAVAQQQDGELVVAGQGNDPVNGQKDMTVFRLTPDGQLDPGFGTGGLVNVRVGRSAMADAVAIQPDGKIVLGGTALTDHNRFAAVRLNSDGSVDQSFGTAGISLLDPPGAAWGMGLDSQGNVVLAGQETYNGRQAYMAARLLPNGAPDPSFGGSGIVTLPIGSSAIGLAMAVQSDDKVVVTGTANTGHLNVVTVRLNTDGSLDQSFGTAGVASYPGSGVNQMALESDGQMVLVGAGASAIRLNADGSPDLTFGKRGLALLPIGTHDVANGVAIQPDGMIVLAGEATINASMQLSVIRISG